jgi:putative membrane protein
MHPGMGPGGFFVALFFLVLFLLAVAALVALIVWLVRRKPKAVAEPSQEARGDDPLRILQQRYAKGEITREEYQAMRDDLRT